jgi:two-component system LytT family sensor kinase
MLNFRNHPLLGYGCAWALAGTYNFLRDVTLQNWRWLLLFNLAHFVVWAFLGRLALPLLRRFPLRLAWRSVLVHALAAPLFAQVDITLGHLIFFQLSGRGAGLSLWQVAQEAYVNCFHLALLTYGGLVCVVQLIDVQRQAVDARHAALAAQLHNLRAQLQPHFLFNTLNGVACVMHYDLPLADRMLNRLAELLRMSLRDGEQAAVRLQQELAFLTAYLDIEQMRFEQRLSVTWSVPDTLLDYPIPPFILQPLVENAIKYGVAPHAAGGSIAIRVYPDAGSLLLEVENDAPVQMTAASGFQIGLRNTRARLESLYGAAQRLDLLPLEGRTLARIRIPMGEPMRVAA